ncbi:PRC-barrel domain-containing protein [Billgrantia sp. Q4P2]|uniref:PRC-barrel domain-containing protein n=1 Tax=Billgrantia sp. Q4P2 TaxID=3463857 RepID=UPI0040577F68
MKRTAIAIAVGALSTGLTHGILAQEEDAQLREQQQLTEEDEQINGEGQAEVRIEEEPADVNVEQEPPDVTVEQQPPEVTIEQQDPNVDVDQAEPDVTVEETGEADVEVQPADEAEAELRDPDEQDQQDSDLAAQDQAAQDQEAQGQGIQVSELENRDLVNQDGEELGDIDRVVRDTQSNDTYVVVTEGGFLGFGEDEMAYPVENLEIRSEGEVVLQSQSGERSTEDFDQDDFEVLDEDEQLNEVQGMN